MIIVEAFMRYVGGRFGTCANAKIGNIAVIVNFGAELAEKTSRNLAPQDPAALARVVPQ
jgi:hypothetical protein